MRQDFPGQYVKPLDLSAKEEAKLSDYLCKQIKKAEQDRGALERKWEVWRKQASSRLEPGEKLPPRAANIDMTLTRERMIQDSARYMNPIFQQDQVYTSRPRTAGLAEQSKDIETLLDDKLDKVDFRSLLADFIEEFQTVHTAVIKTPFVEERRKYKYWHKVDVDQLEMLEEDIPVIEKKDKEGNSRYFVETGGESLVTYGCVPEVVRLDDFFFPITAKSVDDAEWVSHRIWLTKSQVLDRIREGIWKEGSVDDKTIDKIGKPSTDKPMHFPHEEEAGQSPTKQYAIHEVYINYRKSDKSKPVEAIIHIDTESGTILRSVCNFYHSHCRPFITHSFRRINGSLLGEPMTFILEPLHRAYSASFRQRLDAASLANGKIFLVPPGSEVVRKTNQDGLKPGFYEHVGSKEDTFALDLSQPFSQLPELEQRFEAAADKLLGFSGPTYGQETANRPTAQGTISVIEEGRQPQFVRLEQFRSTLQQLAYHLLSRERQFNPDGMAIYKTMPDPQTGQDVVQRTFIEWPEEPTEDYAIVEIKVTSAQMSKNLRKQEIMALVDKIPQMYQTMMQMAGEAVNPQSPMAMPAVKLLNGYQEAVKQMLAEFGVSEAGQLNPNLVQEAQVAQQVQQMVQQLNASNQKLAQENTALKATLQGGPPPGTPGMAGPVGGPPGVQIPPGAPMPPQGPMSR